MMTVRLVRATVLLAACAALNIGHPLRAPARSPQICAASTTDAFSDERQLAALPAEAGLRRVLLFTSADGRLGLNTFETTAGKNGDERRFGAAGVDDGLRGGVSLLLFRRSLGLLLRRSRGGGLLNLGELLGVFFAGLLRSERRVRRRFSSSRRLRRRRSRR